MYSPYVVIVNNKQGIFFVTYIAFITRENFFKEH